MSVCTIRWEQDADAVVVLTLDDPDQSANTMNANYRCSIAATLDRLEAEKDGIAGVIITSAKTTFFAGGDLNDLVKATKDDAESLAATVRESKAVLRRLETLGKPVVAAINGAALGGGLEIALATHRRLVVDDRNAVVGFPEVTLGLLPGAGGVVRSVRILGVVDALSKLLLAGRRLDPRDALQVGIVDEVVPTQNDLLPTAKAWIASHPEAIQPWDSKRYRMPGGTPSDPPLASILPALPATLTEQLKGANYPAPRHIMAAAVESAQVDIDTAFEIEGRYFVDLATGQVAKNMIQAFFFDKRRVRRDHGTPKNWFAPRRAVVVGAGMMGAGIAYVCARAGIEVVLKDVSPEAAGRGKHRSRKLLAKAVADGRTTQEEADAILARILPTADIADAAGADLMIEAVFEDSAVKASVYGETQPQLAPGALLGSNTSTIPITQLAANVARPEDFAGLHFFSPVDRMPLLEIVRGERTSDATLARALDLARLISKTPIVVNDSRGFFTSRVIATFLHEGIVMLLEGIPAASIERASSRAGYPVPVLQLTDELNLQLMRAVRDASKAAAGASWTDHPAERVIDVMLAEKRPGRAAGAGFYDYADDRRTHLWEGLRERFPAVNDPASIDVDELVERMLFAEALEAVRCIDEGVIESVAEANVGSIIGIGFPGWTGGVLQYINGYAGGVAAFAARAHELAERYGERFEPPASLRARTEPYRDQPVPAATA